MKRPPSIAFLEKQCADWNAAHPVGTLVEYHPVIGAPAHRLRATTTAAQVLSGHTAVVWLEDESGCVALDACVPTVRGTAIRYRVIGDIRDLYLNSAPFDASASGVAIVITGFASFMDAGSVENAIIDILRSQSGGRT